LSSCDWARQAAARAASGAPRTRWSSRGRAWRTGRAGRRRWGDESSLSSPLSSLSPRPLLPAPPRPLAPPIWARRAAIPPRLPPPAVLARMAAPSRARARGATSPFCLPSPLSPLSLSPSFPLSEITPSPAPPFHKNPTGQVGRRDRRQDRRGQVQGRLGRRVRRRLGQRTFGLLADAAAGFFPPPPHIRPSGGSGR
jgi:hypothetical protein